MSYSVAGSLGSVAIGDFNGDGRLDFAVADSATQAIVLLQMLTGVDFTQPSLSFGAVTLGYSSTLSTTLINLDSTTLGINDIQVIGSDTDEFSQVNTCSSDVATGHSCSISVTFRPTEAGADSAAVSVSESGTSQQVPLSGSGAAVRHCTCGGGPCGAACLFQCRAVPRCY